MSEEQTQDAEQVMSRRQRAREARARSGAPLGITLIALLLGAAGAGGAAWLYYQDLSASTPPEVVALEVDLRTVEQRLLQISSQVSRMETTLRERASDPRVASLDARVDALMEGQTALRGLMTSEVSAQGLARAQALLALARDRAQLAGDLDVALAASRRAQRQLDALADPRLSPVLAVLADEIALLETATIHRDRGAAAASLRAVQGVVGQLALARRMPDGSPDAAADADPPPDTWYGRTWDGITRGLAGIFEVRRTDTDIRPLRSPQEAWFLRRNLELTLTAARLALVDADVETYVASVDDADDWLEIYFDADDARVRQARDTLNGVRDVLSGEQALGIGQALELLRQYGTSGAP